MAERAGAGPDGGGRRVVVTGLGFITASGHGVAGLQEGLRSGVSPARRIERFDASPFRSQIAVSVEDDGFADYLDATERRRMERFGQFTLAAARMAMEDADATESTWPAERVAIQMGSALGGVAYAEEQVARFLDRGPKAVDPRVALSTYAGAASCFTAIAFGFTGPNTTNAMSCASGAIGVGEAWKLIRRGEADAAIAGGTEAPLAPLSYGAFSIIRAMSTRNEAPEVACRPFDADRDGFVMGEGAGMLVLEEREAALARGVPIYAEIVGYANTNDAHHMTAPRPDTAQASRAMALALERAGIGPDRIDHVNAHASSTPLNDGTESRAIRRVLGDSADAVPVTGTKPFYGHALGASGAIEVGITALAIRNGWIAPTLNLEEPGEECDLDYVTGEGREARIDYALTNSFGFGGINAALVLARHRE